MAKNQKETKDKKNSGRRPRRQNYVDSFRWDFVDEGGARNESIPDEDLFFSGPSDDDFALPALDKGGGKERRNKSVSKNREKAGVPTTHSFVEEDDDLALPSYGRTPIPSDHELHLADTPASSRRSIASVNIPTRPKREQMVWDPDRREYVPLIIPEKKPKPVATTPVVSPKKEPSKKEPPKKEPPKKEPPKKEPPKKEPPKKEPPKKEPPKKEPPKKEPPKKEPLKKEPPKKEPPPKVPPPRRESEVRKEKPAKTPTPSPVPPNSPVPPKPLAPKPPIRRERQEKIEKPPLPVPKPQKEQKEPREQREARSAHRGGVQPFVESPLPNPADAEADSTGFAELGLSDSMLEALKVVRYLEPTPIQAGVFKLVQAGRDLMGQARTGTGKTAAFSIPILEGIETCPPGNDPVALILVPTRELAVQVRDEAIRLAYGRDIRITACYGGKPLAKQIARLRDGIDIIVGTPGRILDLMRRHALSLGQLRWVILDEADRMLDIGFRPDIEKILKQTPTTRQTLLFSATLPPPVVRLAERYMKEPEVLDFSNKAVAVETIDQYYVTVDPERKFDALVYLLNEQNPNQAIIFTRTKRGADRLARLLSNRVQNLAAIHGDLSQTDRDRVMGQFRAGKLRYLVATDVVGRGIDVTGISHIINYDIPKFCDDYVHRVGRTGRMGREGVAFTFVTVQEGTELTRIEMRIDKLLKRAELKGFESFTKPTDPTATLDDDTEPAVETKPVYGKPVRKIRRAL